MYVYIYIYTHTHKYILAWKQKLQCFYHFNIIVVWWHIRNSTFCQKIIHGSAGKQHKPKQSSAAAASKLWSLQVFWSEVQPTGEEAASEILHSSPLCSHASVLAWALSQGLGSSTILVSLYRYYHEDCNWRVSLCVILHIVTLCVKFNTWKRLDQFQQLA